MAQVARTPSANQTQAPAPTPTPNNATAAPGGNVAMTPAQAAAANPVVATNPTAAVAAPGGPQGQQQQQQPGASTSLYVGDLHPDVTEAILFDRFSKSGPVVSIRVCRDAITRRSLGYAYVNFQNHEHAQNALDDLNFEEINGRPCRIMWSQRDPFIRRSGTGNIFIKNLEKSIDNKQLFDTFSSFGNILSCKVVTDENGQSKGYGFVHYETEEEARDAIEKVNGKLIMDQEVYVAKFLSRKEREAAMGGAHKFTNIYVKNLPVKMSEDELRKVFGQYGEITALAIMTREDGTSRGFGFVNFKEPDHAAKAVEEMNGKEMEGSDTPLFVGRAMKKRERERMLQQEYEQKRLDRDAKFKGVNLYVKHLDESVDEDELRELFSKHGNITSVKIMRDEKDLSRGFGFVCFSQPEEATKAVSEMHHFNLHGKPLYVTLALRKADRQRIVEAERAQRVHQQMMQPNFGGPYAMAPGMPHNPMMYNPMMQSFARNPAMASRGGWNMPKQGMGMGMPMGMPMGRMGAPMGQPQRNNGGRGGRQQGGRQGGQPGMQQQGGQQGMRPGPGGMRGQQGRMPQQQMSHPGMGMMHMGNNQMNMANNRMQQQQQQQQQQRPRPQGGAGDLEDLSKMTIGDLPPVKARQLIGEHIFPRIQELYPDQPNIPGKLTGMLLEMEIAELLHLIDDKEMLTERARDAYNVLQEHKRRSEAGEAPTADAPAAVETA